MNPLLPIIILLFVGLGCSKDGVEKDTESPVITLDTPAMGDVYVNGDQISVKGSITDNKEITEVHIHISNADINAMLFDIHLFPKSTTASFNQFVTLVGGVHYRVQIIAKDKMVNEARKSIEFTCN